jgi:alpha-N-acetylglucosamine transferase
MSILFYTDKNFEYMAKYLIESLTIQKVDTEWLYYTIGFDSTIEHPNLIKKRWDIDENKPRFEFYKPSLLLDALKDYDKVIFLDSDIIVGRRFETSKFDHDFDYPLASYGNWEYPWAIIYRDGEKLMINEDKLMKSLDVKERSMYYVYSCFMSVNRKCIDFLKEWESFCINPYFLENREIYYPFQDETSFNVLLWKRNCTQNYGRIFLNTLYSDPLEFVEDKVNDGFEGRVYSVPEQFVDNSSDIMFYHGLKNEVELKNSLNYLRKQSESKGGGAINE